jgi:hypothetical protein
VPLASKLGTFAAVAAPSTPAGRVWRSQVDRHFAPGQRSPVVVPQVTNRRRDAGAVTTAARSRIHHDAVHGYAQACGRRAGSSHELAGRQRFGPLVDAEQEAAGRDGWCRLHDPHAQPPKQLVGHLFAAVGDESLASIVERMEPELS